MPTVMRIAYPVFWSRLGRQASWEQAANTAAAFARLGHDVTILMPRGRDDPAIGADDVRDHFQLSGDFRLVQRDSRWAGERLWPSLMWLRQLFRDPEVARADLLYSRIPAMLAMGGLCPIPFATDHYRLWPDELRALRPLFRRTARHPRCLGLILHSDHAAGSYRRSGVAEERILVAHNGIPTGTRRPIGKHAARAALGLPADRSIALYAGRIDPSKGLDQLLALAALRPEVQFLLVGSEGEGAIERLARGMENVRVEGWATPDALPVWLEAADVLLIPASSAPLKHFGTCVLPMKLFLYLAAARPILAPFASDTFELLADGQNALLVPPDRPELAAAALDRLLHEPGLAERLGESARRLSLGLTWDARAEKITAFLRHRLATMCRTRADRPRALRRQAAAVVIGPDQEDE
jgi:glycosyltransferase involved in cell wall biosynthesis